MPTPNCISCRVVCHKVKMGTASLKTSKSSCSFCSETKGALSRALTLASPAELGNGKEEDGTGALPLAEEERVRPPLSYKWEANSSSAGPCTYSGREWETALICSSVPGERRCSRPVVVSACLGTCRCWGLHLPSFTKVLPRYVSTRTHGSTLNVLVQSAVKLSGESGIIPDYLKTLYSIGTCVSASTDGYWVLKACANQLPRTKMVGLFAVDSLAVLYF